MAHDRARVDTAVPRELGIHSAIPTPSGDDSLPEYVERDFDFQLRTALSAYLPKRGNFVVMVGGSSTGKTRSLYEAVCDSVPEWWLVRPPDATSLLEAKDAPPSQTVFWLDELQQYLGAQPALTHECVWALVRHGNLVVGTLWPDQYAKWTDGHDDVHQLVKSASVVSVLDSLSPVEFADAQDKAAKDSRIRAALSARGVGLTQVLAGGPQLVRSWELPVNPYVKAMIAVAADAHRLGVQSALSEQLLADAMYGYLERHQRHESTEFYLAQALPHTTRPLYGDVSPLMPVDGGRAGTLGGYAIADYLAQHVRKERRAKHVPEKAWTALLTHLERPEDLRRLADSATVRLRLCYAEVALTRLAQEFGDGKAAVELADLLVRQDRLDEAVRVLRHRLDNSPQDRMAGKKLSHVQDLWQRVDEIRPPGGSRSQPIPAEVAEILADGGVCDDLRREADAGDVFAAERLVELLADRGYLDELRDRADHRDPQAAEALADLYAAWGEVDLLRERADRGDRPARLRLSKLHRQSNAGVETKYQISQLRAEVDDGQSEAALKLCTLLFDLRDYAGLRAEVDAGTSGAAQRLIALYTANRDPELISLRAFGLDADGDVIYPSQRP